MSRLHSYLSPSSAPSSARDCDQVPVGISDDRGPDSRMAAPPSIGFPHRLFVPEHYESAYEYPVVVWLHSDHSSEYEIDHIMPALSKRNYVALALRGSRKSNRSSQLFRWGSSLTDYALTEECIFHAIEEIVGSISIDSTKVFLAGFGKGATLAQWVGLRNPENFAGVIACNGPFPSNKRALAQWKQSRSLPVLTMQSSDSNRFCIDQIIHTMKTAHCAGLNYRLIRFESRSPEPTSVAQAIDSPNRDPEFEGSLQTEMLSAANRFMMGIVTNSDIPLLDELQSQDQSLWLQ